MRREALLAFLRHELGPALTDTGGLEDSPPQALNRRSAENPDAAVRSDATRTERLLLLVLSHLGVPPEVVEAAWTGRPQS